MVSLIEFCKLDLLLISIAQWKPYYIRKGDPSIVLSLEVNCLDPGRIYEGRKGDNLPSQKVMRVFYIIYLYHKYPLKMTLFNLNYLIFETDSPPPPNRFLDPPLVQTLYCILLVQNIYTYSIYPIFNIQRLFKFKCLNVSN